MPTVAGIKIKSKQPRVRNPLFADEKYTGPEPAWDTERAMKMTEEEFDHHLRRSFRYYNYFYTQKDTKKYLVEWMKSSGRYDRDCIREFERSSDRWLSMTACSLIMAHRQGMPLKDRHVEFINQNIERCITENGGEVLKTETIVDKKDAAAVYRPTIQDRLNEKTSELIGDIEGTFDQIVNNEKTSFKSYDFLTANKVPQGQLGKYEAVFTARRAELEQAQSKEDSQLTEGYRHWKAADYRRVIAWIDELLSGIEQYRGVKKATKKAKVRKAPSKEKQVSKVKYAKEDKVLKIVSINPADIIGATELWIYNSKTRKLGKYVAASYQTLGIKGTTIIGFDEDKSVAKTLRKPDEQLKEFARAGKVQLRTWLKDIRAVEVKLNGRLNTDILLLKVA